MKRIGLVTSMALALCAGTVNASANGCCFWPFWAFGLGIGLGAAVTSAATAPRYSYPVYTYPYSVPAYSYHEQPPVYAHHAPARPAQTAPAPTATPAEPERLAWVPSSPGAGRWVPDPQPYRYVQSNESPPVKGLSTVGAMTVSMVSSPGGVPVHVNQ